MVKQLKLKITGMHCGSCEKLISGALSDIPGVQKSEIDSKNGEGKITYDDKKLLDVNQIIEAIEKEGYHASKASKDKPEESVVVHEDSIGENVKIRVESQTEADGQVTEDEKGQPVFRGKIHNNRKIEFDIPKNIKEKHSFVSNFLKQINYPSFLELGSSQSSHSSIEMSHNQPENLNSLPVDGNKRISLSLSGMDCASCAAIIEKSLKKVPGVKTANVNFSSEKATVIFDESKSSVKDYVNAVSKAGYKAEIVDEANQEAEKEKKKKTIKGYYRKFLFSLILSSPMLYFMFLDFFNWLPGKVLISRL